MRDYALVVPSDGVASNTEEENEFALAQMRKLLHADTTPTDALDLEALIRRAADRAPHRRSPRS